MPTIHVLPTHLVNKIAAGEVIERPASVVKELLENALDAGAGRIELSVADGGRGSIVVSDDGKGMAPEDLELAFHPHATSKLSDEDDLFRIGTMGFRGEALASIASISHAHIRTRLRDGEDPSGYEIEASGETVGHVRPCAAPSGTTISVRDLFYNTPARRKFMRTAQTEFSHISEQLTRVALPHPQVAFVLTHNGRESMNLPAVASTAQRAADIFGPELADGLLPVVERTGPVGVSGLVGKPEMTRSTGKWQYFFLNGRYVRDRLLSHALKEAYRGLIDPRRFPVALLFVEVGPAEVDVNVHPTKIEVRFQNGQAVHGAVLAALKDTLNRANLTPGASLAAAQSDAAPADEADEIAPGAGNPRAENLKQALADFFKHQPAPQPRLAFSDAPPTPAAAPPAKSRMGLSPFTSAAQVPAIPSAPANAPSSSVSQDNRYAGTQAPAGVPRFLQVHNTYIVTADPDGLTIVDQHALHERILYNEFRRRLAEEPLESQRLLVPEPVGVSASEANLLETVSEVLDRLGIEVAPFGPGTIAVQRFPGVLIRRKVSAGPFVRELLDDLGEVESPQSEHVLEDVLAMMACKAAIKAGDPLSEAEIADLLARRADTDKASACPHGRPTTLHLSLADLEKQFKRT